MHSVRDERAVGEEAEKPDTRRLGRPCPWTNTPLLFTGPLLHWWYWRGRRGRKPQRKRRAVCAI